MFAHAKTGQETGPRTLSGKPLWENIIFVKNINIAKYNVAHIDNHTDTRAKQIYANICLTDICEEFAETV